MTLVELKMQSELEIGHTSGVLKVLIRSNSSNCVHNSSPNSFGFIRATRWINSLMRHHVQHVCMFWLRQRVLWRLLRQLGWGSQAVSALMTHFKNCGLPLPQVSPVLVWIIERFQVDVRKIMVLVIFFWVILRTFHSTPDRFGDLWTGHFLKNVSTLLKSSPSGHFSTCNDNIYRYTWKNQKTHALHTSIQS